MPRIDPGYNQPKKKPVYGPPAPKRKPVYGPPAPKRKPTGVFKPGVPRPATAPITIDAPRAAQRKVDTARRALPAATVAAPPVISRGKAKPGGKPMSPAQVVTFLRSQSKVTQHARKQIVTSIRKNLGNTRGRERQEMTQRLLREIATDPRYEGTRRAIEHYTALERQQSTPQTRATIKAGPQPRRAKVGIGPVSASINLTAAGQAITNAAEKHAPGLARTTAEAKFAKAALSDIAHLPLMVPQTAYEVAAAAKEAAGGDTKRAKALAKSFTEGVYGHVIRGDWDGLEDYFREHPVYAFLELRGGKGVGGRGAGAVMRSGALGKGAKRAASTQRRDLNLSGEGARVADRQHYSPDVITKAFQVLAERKRDGKPRLGDHRLRRRADFESDMAAATSRAVRADEGKRAKEAKPKGPLAEVVGLVVQGVVRPRSLEADLRKELARLDEKHATAEFSTGAQKRQNRATAGAIREVLGSPAAMARIGEVAQSGRANVRAINELEGRAKDLNAITPERADRAKLFPPAQAHLGAEYSDAPFRAARGREVAAGRALRDERTRLSEKVRQIKATEDGAAKKVARLAQRHKSERGKEGHNRQIAAYYVGDQRFEMRGAAVQAAKDAGIPVKQIRRVALTHGEARRVGELSAARRNYQAARARRREAEAELRALNRRGDDAVPARKAFEDARAERKAAAIGGTESLNVAGRRLPNEEIRAVVGADVAHLPHHTRDRGARAYYQTAFAGRKNLDSSKKRTGAAFEKGAVDASYQAVTEHRIRLRGVVNRIAEHDRIIHSIATKGPGGRMMTWDQAEKIASNAKDKGATLVPYRAVPGSYDRARMEEIATRQGASEMPALEKLIESEFANRLKEPAAGDRTARNVVLVPEQIVNQLQEQHAVSSTRGKAGNVAVDVFRRTVLPFSTKWLTGNTVEAGVRLGAVGAGPNALRVGELLFKEMEKIDAEQALRVKAALTGGLLFGNRGLTVKRVSEHFEGTALAKPAAAVSVAGQLPVVKQLGQLMKGYTDAVFAFNRSIESSAQTAAFGKWAQREMQEMTGSWWKATRAQEKALHDVAMGLMDTKNIHDAARYIDQTLGQYSRFSPPMRRFIQQAAPFLPWYLNAARFVFWTLPAKHPIKTGMYTLVAQNLQDDFDASHKSLPPGDLRGDIVTDDGSVLPYSRYMPFGAFGSVFGGGNEQLTALVDPLFPQFKSAALAMFGLNFSGKRTKVAPEDRGEGAEVTFAVRATMVVNSLLEAFVPVVGIAKRVREGGSTGWDNSTIWDPETKPGTKVKGGAANRILNPFRPSPIKARGGGQAAPAPTPTAAPAPPSLEDELLDNLDQSLGDAQAQQALEDELLDNLYGGG
jgi:hypothetical protein